MVGLAWEKLVPPRPSLSFEIVQPDGASVYFNLGPHPPRLWPEDVDLVHRIWLELSEQHFGAQLHHRDVIRAALRRFERELNSETGVELMDEIKHELGAGDHSDQRDFEDAAAVTRDSRLHP